MNNVSTAKPNQGIDHVREQFHNLHEFVAPARRNLSRQRWDYLIGGAETETTCGATAWRSIRWPSARACCATSEKSTPAAKLLGHKLRIPVMLAPIGSLEDIVAGGGAAVAEAAARFGVLQMLELGVPSPASRTGGRRRTARKIFQLYVRGDQAWVDDHVERAVDNGYVALCLTVDSRLLRPARARPRQALQAPRARATRPHRISRRALVGRCRATQEQVRASPSS